MRFVLCLCMLALAACATGNPAENSRNEDLYRVARTCENGSLVVTGITTDGTPTTRTTSSGASERPAFEKCYVEKSAPIWKALLQRATGRAELCRQVIAGSREEKGPAPILALASSQPVQQ